jgi:hypothetical protein
MKTPTSKNKTGTNAAATLADINTQIEQLKQQRIGLAEPLKGRYAELRSELLNTGNQIRELDPTWKPEPTKPKADLRIAEILAEKGRAMTAEEIVQAVGSVFSKWKVTSTLKKKATGPKAVFTVNEGKYSMKA